MKVCAVSTCRKDSSRNPGVVFFNLPKDPCARGEWLEVLGLKYKDSNQNIKVCEAHFRPKDFGAGKRQLKVHAVPALNLGVKIEPVSDDDFMVCDSDNEDDVIAEVKKFSGACTSEIMEPKEEKIEQEPEPEPGRRPSRRAAREAAKKIYNTVRNCGTVPDADDPDISIGFTPHKSTPSPRTAQRQRAKAYQNIRVPPPNIDLLMECHEELLSTVQAEALLQAQLQYNMVMKTLRSLKASNVRIIVAPADPIVSENSDDGTSNPSDPEEAQTAKDSKESSAVEEAKTEKGAVVPMELSEGNGTPSPAPILS